ncbi:uncharacterized protein LOC105195304 [Solenopsis invicta]|uniref:uncharacterized protein LOC105195304 n=1 Tax=Solenopsis invicta TaxID=13686 RepID=UPI000595BC3B|nr:uncharacterized protein LOC105195304 [Solenopsis invicta]
MLSKWLLVFLLALELQNSSANNYFNNHIDVTKLNIPLTFYNPNTGLTLTGALEKIGRNPFLGIGFRGVECACNHNFTCSCCSSINITRINFERHACGNVIFYPQDLAFKLNLVINEREILAAGPISFRNPPVFCVPYPPFANFCVRIFDISVDGNNLHACVDFEIRVLSTWPLLIVHFDCIKLGADGIAWMKPENGSNVPLAIQPEVNGPEIYDQVDFEPIEFPNNHTWNMTLEEENIIGQLKL